jgi:uncharacterized BrkB/YihY/UPF0761 family membrane protein
MADRVERVRAWLEQFAFVARHLQALDRANGLRFTRWAAAIALFGYLALFPLAVLAFVAFGAVLANFPEVRTEVEEFLKDAIPLLFDPPEADQAVDIEQVARVTKNAGIISIIGLLIAGLGWVDSTMEGVRRMQGAMRRPRSWLLLRFQDTGALLLMGTVLLVALVGAVLFETFGTSALNELGLEGGASLMVRLSAIVILGLLVWIVVVALYSLAWWGRPHRRLRSAMLGALYTTVLMILLGLRRSGGGRRSVGVLVHGLSDLALLRKLGGGVRKSAHHAGRGCLSRTTSGRQRRTSVGRRPREPRRSPGPGASRLVGVDEVARPPTGSCAATTTRRPGRARLRWPRALLRQLKSHCHRTRRHRLQPPEVPRW